MPTPGSRSKKERNQRGVQQKTGRLDSINHEANKKKKNWVSGVNIDRDEEKKVFLSSSGMNFCLARRESW
jgi:hypothetical protein